MTIEDLLEPRIKVIALYPDCCFHINEILQLKYREHNGKIYGWQNVRRSPGIWDKAYFQNYPHLFRELEWWEDRKPEEMPEYVKDKEDKVFMVSSFSPRGSSVILWLINKLDGNSLYESYSLNTSCFSVSTKEEYEAYLLTI